MGLGPSIVYLDITFSNKLSLNKLVNTATSSHIHISSKSAWYKINLAELWRYRDLLKMLVKRDVVIVYKQTVLGPVWFVLQPILTAVIFTFVFGNIANLDTDGLPKFAFYLSGLVIWNYFSDCFIKTSDTFFTNQNLFGKVYFPRLIVPIGIISSGLIKFLVQFILLVGVCFYHYFFTKLAAPSIYVLLLPLLLIIMASLGMGLGLIFTSLTTKYRDLKFLLQFGVQLIMWLTSIAYPLSMVKGNYLILLKFNPLTHIIEALKLGLLGEGYFNVFWLGYSIFFAFAVLILGIFVFNKTQKDFIDRI